MKPGKVVDSFRVKGKDGKKIQVIFRYPSMKDVKAALKMVNEIRDEADYLGRRRHETIKTEKAFIAKQIENMCKRKGIILFVEINGELVGDASIQPLDYEVSEHVGKFGIMLKEEFTGIGIGTRLMRKVLQLAKKHTRFKIIESSYFSKNTRSRKLHKKLGFKQCGKFPKGDLLRDGSYCDHIQLYKFIKKL